MSNTNNQPARTLKDGLIKATIWRNATEKGIRYSVEFTRSYEVSGEWKSTNSFSRNEVLRVQHLAGKAYDAIAKLSADDKSSEKEGA